MLSLIIFFIFDIIADYLFSFFFFLLYFLLSSCLAFRQRRRLFSSPFSSLRDADAFILLFDIFFFFHCLLIFFDKRMPSLPAMFEHGMSSFIHTSSPSQNNGTHHITT